MSALARGPVLLLIAYLAAAVVAQERPESSSTRRDTASTRPARKLAVRTLPFPVKGHGSVPSACSFSPDGRLLAATRGYHGYDFNVYDLQRGELVHTADAQPDLANDPRWANWPPAFNSRSDRLAFTVDHGVSFLDLVEGQVASGQDGPAPIPAMGHVPEPEDDRVVARRGRDDVHGERGGVSTRAPERRDIQTGLRCGPADRARTSSGSCSQSRSALESGYETALLSGNEVVERLPGVGILACSADKSSWVVARRAPIAGAESAPGSRPAIEIWDGPERRARAPADHSGGCVRSLRRKASVTLSSRPTARSSSPATSDSSTSATAGPAPSFTRSATTRATASSRWRSAPMAAIC